MNSHSQRALCTPLPSAIQQLAPQQNGHNSTQTGTVGLCHKRRPDEVSSWAPDDNFWSLGRADLGLHPAELRGPSSLQHYFSGKFGQNCHTTLEVTGSMHLRKDRQHTHKSPISSGWHHACRQHPCCQQYTPDHLAPAAPPHLPLCLYKPSSFPGQCENDGELDPGTDPAENLLFFFLFFFKGLFLTWILSQTRLRAWLHNAYVSTRKPSNEHPWGGQDRCHRYPRHLNELVKQQPPDSRLKSHRASVNWGWHIKNQKNKTRNSYTQVT